MTVSELKIFINTLMVDIINGKLIDKIINDEKHFNDMINYIVDAAHSKDVEITELVNVLGSALTIEITLFNTYLRKFIDSAILSGNGEYQEMLYIDNYDAIKDEYYIIKKNPR